MASGGMASGGMASKELFVPGGRGSRRASAKLGRSLALPQKEWRVDFNRPLAFQTVLELNLQEVVLARLESARIHQHFPKVKP